jgi:uncharacterized protein (DUF1330 family)
MATVGRLAVRLAVSWQVMINNQRVEDVGSNKGRRRPMSYNIIEVMDKFASEDLDKGPIAVLNLIKFRKDGGEAFYKRYIEEAAARNVTPPGAEIAYLGRVAELLQGDIGEWDLLGLMMYPSRRVMREMITSKAYQEVQGFREDAIERSVLYVTDALMPFRTWTQEVAVATPWIKLSK